MFRRLISTSPLIILSLLILTSGSPLRQDSLRTFSPEELREDFQILRSALEEGHGGFYRYTPKEELDAHFDSIEAELTRPMLESEFLRHLSGIISHVRDGHTRVRPSSSYSSYTWAQKSMLPLAFHFSEGKTWIFRNYLEEGGPEPGAQVIAINGEQVGSLIEEMFTLLPSDGRGRTIKYRKLSSPSGFNDTYTLLRGFHEIHELIVKGPGELPERTVQAESMTVAELTRRMKELEGTSFNEMPPIELEFVDDIAILTIRTFSLSRYQSADIPFLDFLKSAFAQIEEKGTTSVVLDLRNNGGGADMCGKMLYAHLTDESFRFYDRLELRNDYFSFLEYTDMAGREDFSSSVRKDEYGRYLLNFHTNLGIQKPVEPLYLGRIFILMNGSSFSGTGEFMSIAHYNRRAVFIGEESGAGYSGNTSGIMPTLSLPNSGIRVVIPMLGYYMAVEGYEYPDRGILPDHEVIPTIQDLLNGRDPVMEYALELARKEERTAVFPAGAAR